MARREASRGRGTAELKSGSRGQRSRLLWAQRAMG